MTNKKNFYKHIVPNKKRVIMANGVSVSNDGNGDGIVSCENGNNEVKELALNDVLLIPELETSLVSISRLVKQEMTVVFDIDRAGIYKDQLIAEADHVNGLFKLKRTEHSLLATTNTHRENCQHQWHRRFGHRSPKIFDIVQSCDFADGFKIEDCGIRTKCECCIECKLSKQPFPKH